MNKSALYIIRLISLVLLLVMSVTCDKPEKEEINNNPCGSAHWGPGHLLLCFPGYPANGAIVSPANLTIKWHSLENSTSSLYLGKDRTNLQCISQQSALSYAVTNLEPNTTYYWYVSISKQCYWGCSTQVSTFTTAPDANLPYIITSPVIIHPDIPPRLGGNVLFEGSSKVSEKGIFYSLNSNPETGGTKLQMENGPGIFSVLLNGLKSNTTYYVKAYSTNDSGTVLGSEVTFTTGPNSDYKSVADTDGNTYYVINIGNQVWMAENLRATKFNDGTPIPNIEDNYTWETSILPAYCWYNNNPGFESTYGALYNWYTIDSASSGHKNVCPAGWHIPYDTDWASLVANLGGEASAGMKLKETGDYWLLSTTAGDNSSEFSALAGGERFERPGSYMDGTSSPFAYMGSIAAWWSYTSSVSSHWLQVTAEKSSAEKFPSQKNGGYSIRCIKDAK